MRPWRWSALAACLCVVGSLAACDRVPDHAPTLGELQDGDQAKASGRWLMSAPEGLIRLDAPPREAAEVLIGVHGFESEGYEWVQPLKVLSQGGAQVYFFRWDWTQCPDPAAERLRGAIEDLIKAQPGVTRVRLFGHSYGGVISTLVASSWRLPVPIEVNVIAAPLAGHPRLTDHCGFSGVKAPAAGARLKQWRTRKDQDGAFKDMAVDPQLVEIAGSDVVLLPEAWQGRRLGHNWSISWVADHLAAAPSP